jgi:gamma-glutamylcyclotransferase (GGCT)/AIG2-like uncharacterized protein YtfP
MKKRYIAYGSNMDEGQMAYRCPTARLLGQAEVEGYRLLFKGSLTGAYATIEPQEGGRVPALVWEIGEADEASLDRYEGFPSFYYKKDLTVRLDGQEVTAMVYIMDERRRLGEPGGAYYGVLERAYEKFGFPMEILQTALKAGGTLPGGWRTGDTCFLLTHKKKGLTNQYTVRGYDGRYFELTDRAQNFYRVSIGRMFRSREAALASLRGNGGVQDADRI